MKLYTLERLLNSPHQSFYEFRRQLSYKTKWYKGELIIVDRFFPSSKLCHACGEYKKELALSHREWTCICGILHDRDVNAAINIENWMSTVSSTGIDACGAGGAGMKQFVHAKPCGIEARI